MSEPRRRPIPTPALHLREHRPGLRLRRARKHLPTRIFQAWQLYVLLAPALIYLVVFKYWPMYGAQIAFRDYNPVDGFFWSPWVGWTTSSPS